MPDFDYSHVTLVIDHSGSMATMQEAATAGVNRLLAGQHDLPGRLTVTLVEFDHTFDTISRMSPDAFEYQLAPAGYTALLDAVGREIEQTGSDLRALPDDQRPGRVLFVVVTDGEENASQEYDLDTIQSLVEQQRTKYGWTFQFIGAGEHAWQGRTMRMPASSFEASDLGVQRMFLGLDAAMANYRSDPSFDAAFQMPDSLGDGDWK
jgi:hypothetical protein